jgi:hypothetical protein
MQSTKETQRVLLALFFGPKKEKRKKSLRVVTGEFSAKSDPCKSCLMEETR